MSGEALALQYTARLLLSPRIDSRLPVGQGCDDVAQLLAAGLLKRNAVRVRTHPLQDRFRGCVWQAVLGQHGPDLAHLPLRLRRRSGRFRPQPGPAQAVTMWEGTRV